MCVRYLGFLLLVWFPGGLYAQSAGQHCSPPSLEEGYFVPEGDTYFHEAMLTYACNEGFKPAVEKGWWATSTCQNGQWSPTPQCIGKGDCIPPEIPNAKKQSQNGWYEDGNTFTITCDEGYEPKGQVDTAGCTNGTWSPVLVCESIQACGEPPKIPHAVVIHKRYQEEFVVNTEVQYECEAGYAVEGAEYKKTIVCKAGNWTDGPTCSRTTGPGTGQGGGAGGGHTSANSGTQLGGGDRGTRPGTGQGGSAGTGQSGSVEEGTAGGHTTSTVGSGGQPGGGGRGTGPGPGQGGSAGGGHTTSANSGTQLGGGGRGTRPGTGQAGAAGTGQGGAAGTGQGGSAGPGQGGAAGTGQGGAAGRGTGPGPGQGGSAGSSTTSGWNDRPLLMPVEHCGAHPVVENGVLLKEERMSLKYQCKAYYTTVGLDTVTCYNDGTWSEIPTCKEAFCRLDLAQYRSNGFDRDGVEFLEERETKLFPCIWQDFIKSFQCSNGKIIFSECCRYYDMRQGRCQLWTAQ